MKKYDPIDAIRHLVTSIGARPATSLAEARAAAYVGGQMRRAGMRVSADTFPASTHANLAHPMITLAGLLVALLTGVVPLPSLLLSLWLLVLVISNTLLTPLSLPSLVSSSSQNIVGTRASEQRPRWRLIVLGALDSQPAERGGGGLVGWQHTAAVSYLAACALLALLAALTLASGWHGWWYGQIIPAVVLVAALFPLRARGASLVGGSAVLAVLLNAAERLATLRSVELWVVALGATTTGDSGLRDLLARYPFPSDDTLFLAIETIENEHLAYAARQGAIGQHTADALLVRLLNEPHPVVVPPLAPYSSPLARSLALPLHAHGYRAMSLLTCNAAPTTSVEKPEPAASTSTAAMVGPRVLERATETIVGIVRRLDAEEA